MKKTVLFLLLFTAVSCTLSPKSEPLPTVNPQQQIIFHNGIVVTMDEAKPQAEALAVNGQMIMTVGTNEEVLALQTAETTIVNLSDRTLMPGFVDTRLFNDAEQYLDVTLPKVQQIALENGITTLGNMEVITDE